MQLQNGRTLLEVDERTGSIVRIADAFTGADHFEASRDPSRLGRLLRVIAPVVGWSSRPGDSWLSGRPQVVPLSDGVVVRYAGLAGRGGSIAVQAEVEMRVPDDADGIELTLRLTNHGDTDLTDVLFPWLGGWSPMTPGHDALTLGGARRIDAHGFPVNRGITFSRWHQRESFTYPIDLFAPWLDASGASGGVGLTSRQSSPRNLGVFIENLAGYEPGLDLSVGFVHFTRTAPGQTWQSPPVRITVHAGDWHATADAYSGWVDSWFTAPPTPAWARRSIGFQNVLFRSFDGTAMRPFSELPAIARAGVQAGMPHVCVWDYSMLGAYSRFDDIPQLQLSAERASELRGAIEASRALGAHVSSLQNYRLMNPTTQLYRDVGHEEVCLRLDGSPYVEEYSGSLHHGWVIARHVGPMVYPIDARVSSVQERVLGWLSSSFDLGFESHFYDQPFENMPSYRMEGADSGSDGPDGAHAGTVDLLKQARALLARRSPQGILIGEYCDVFGSEAIDLWMSWYTEMGDAIRACYSIPQTMNSWVVDHDVTAATRAFVIGAQLCLTVNGGEGSLADVPSFSEHIARLAKLKQRAERLHHARFRDHQGIDVEVQGPVNVGAFASTMGQAVIIGAGSDGGSAHLRLTDVAAATRAAPAGPARLLGTSGERELSRSDDLRLELGPNEVAIWYP